MNHLLLRQLCLCDKVVLRAGISCCAESLQTPTLLHKDEYFTHYHCFADISQQNGENKSLYQSTTEHSYNKFYLLPKKLSYFQGNLSQKSIDVNSSEQKGLQITAKRLFRKETSFFVVYIPTSGFDPCLHITLTQLTASEQACQQEDFWLWESLFVCREGTITHCTSSGVFLAV